MTTSETKNARTTTNGSATFDELRVYASLHEAAHEWLEKHYQCRIDSNSFVVLEFDPPSMPVVQWLIPPSKFPIMPRASNDD